MASIITETDFSKQFFAGPKTEKQLITAEILYRLPDYKDLLQTYIWQHLDSVPKFPELKGFMAYWNRNLEGPIHSVTISHHPGLEPIVFKLVDDEITLH